MDPAEDGGKAPPPAGASPEASPASRPPTRGMIPGRCRASKARSSQESGQFCPVWNGAPCRMALRILTAGPGNGDVAVAPHRSRTGTRTAASMPGCAARVRRDRRPRGSALPYVRSAQTSSIDDHFHSVPSVGRQPGTDEPRFARGPRRRLHGFQLLQPALEVREGAVTLRVSDARQNDIGMRDRGRSGRARRPR